MIGPYSTLDHKLNRFHMAAQIEELSKKILKKQSALFGVLDGEEEQLQWIKIRQIDEHGRLLSTVNEKIFLRDPSVKKLPVRLYLKFPREELLIQITGTCESYFGQQPPLLCEPGYCCIRINMIYGEFSYGDDQERKDIFSLFKAGILRILRQSPSKKIVVLR